jgi:hypothetical protein
VAVQRLGGPRGRTDFSTIPDGDYRKEYALLVGEIAAVAEEGFDTADRKNAYLTEVVPAWEAVRNVDDKLNRRGLLARPRRQKGWSCEPRRTPRRPLLRTV